MSLKSKGSNAERELLHMFWAKGWPTIRSAGSGSMKYPGPDLLVGSKEMNRRMAIECKTSKNPKIYLSQWDINQLKDFADVFDARPYFAVKFPKKEWLFVMIEDIEKTKTGFVIDSEVAERRGILLDELIKHEVKV